MSTFTQPFWLKKRNPVKNGNIGNRSSGEGKGGERRGEKHFEMHSGEKSKQPAVERERKEVNEEERRVRWVG